MNIKTISIVLTVLVLAVAATLLMQKGSYVSQATEHYNKTTGNTHKGSSKILENVGTNLDVNKMVWALAVETMQTAKSSQDQAKLESKYFPSTKGSNNKAQKTRRFSLEPSYAYFIVSNFDKVDTDKKSNIWYLSKLKSVDVSSLLGKVAMSAAAEEEEEGEEE